MRVGILTMSNVDNHGSLLQAYSLKRIVESFGHEVVFFDIVARPEDDNLLTVRSEYIEDKEYSDDIIGKISKIDKYLLNRIRHKINSQKQNRLFDCFRIQNLRRNEEMATVDYCIIGSDEVFNCLLKSKWGFTSQLFGNIPEAEHVITYAASCGSTSINQVPNNVKDIISMYFKRIEAFSVRDDNTLQFVESLSDKIVCENLDPVVIGNFEKELQNTKLPTYFSKRKYCIVYSYPNRFHRPNDIIKIKKFCHRNDMELVTLGGYQMWIKNSFALDPFELLKVFQNAEFVITDTFHGAIFSSMYSKKFAIMLRKSNYNKLSDLVARLHIESHMVSSFEELQDKYKLDKNEEVLNRIISDGRSEAEDYLKKYLL